MTNSRGKILVIRGGAIGDFILTLPVFSALRAQFPGTHLGVLGYPHISQIALVGGLVDEVRSIEARALAGFFARNAPLDQDLSKKRYNVAVSRARNQLWVVHSLDPSAHLQPRDLRSKATGHDRSASLQSRHTTLACALCSRKLMQ